MTLPTSEYADAEDSVLLKQLKASAWEKAEQLLDTTTAEGKAMVQQGDKYDNLPLHVAIGYKAPDELTLKILHLYPDAAKVHGTDYWLPLHVAAMWGVSAAVLEPLILAYPQGLDDPGEPDIKGRTPRHFKTVFAHNTALLERSTDEWLSVALTQQQQVP
jgi:hypothetical protein